MRRFVARLWTFFHFTRAEAELSRELSAHLQLLEDRYVADGMSPDEARFAARRAFGGQVEQMKERQRDTRGFRVLDEGWLDIKLGARMLVKYPGLTLVAVFALSLAIAGGAAYLEFLNDMTRPTLPGSDGDRVVGIYNWDVAQGTAEHRALSEFASWRGQLRSIEDLGAAAMFERNLATRDGRSEPVSGVQISASAFRLMPAAPLLGRPLVPTDEEPSAAPVAVIGESLWHARFGADPGIIGQTITLGSESHTVVGVMPQAFGFPVNQTLWVPLRLDATTVRRDEGPPIRMFGRLAPGVTAGEAEAELAAFAARSSLGSVEPVRPLQPQVEPWVTSLWSSVEDGPIQLAILYSANLFFIGLLAVAGANVATLVFARTATRESEITVRTALGASRGRIIAQLFAEALVLCSLAGAVGLWIASLALAWGKEQWLAGTAGGARPPFWWNDRFESETLFYTAALALFAATIVGVLPGLKATGPEMQVRLKQAAVGGSSMKFGGVWTGVIVGQVALTVIFLLSAVSLGWNLYASGYQGDGVTFAAHQFLSARLEADTTASAGPGADAVTRQRRMLDASYRELERRLLDEPGVTGVTYASAFPGMKYGEFILELADSTIPPPPGVDLLWVRTAAVADDFFETFDLAVVAGRGFTAVDVAFDRPVAVVDETFVATVLGGRNPIGQLLRERNMDEGANETARAAEPPWYEIVGVVRDLSTRAVKTSEDAVLYRPTSPSSAAPLVMAVRVAGDAGVVAPRLRALAAETDPTLRLHEVMSLDQVNDADRVAFRFFLWVIAIVSGVALILAAAGVYALLSFTVVRRTREIGIRAAVGADQRRILTGIFSRAFSQVGLGIMAGSIPGTLLVAFGAPEVARGSGPTMALAAFLGVATFTLAVTVLACVVPAQRALRIQPTEALRADA
jgi:putative ABC transport system permease protein